MRGGERERVRERVHAREKERDSVRENVHSTEQIDWYGARE